jgi:F0F1-type ATP synthase gamma subunit
MVDIYCIGKKAEDYLKVKGYHIAQTRHDLVDELSFENTIPLYNPYWTVLPAVI